MAKEKTLEEEAAKSSSKDEKLKKLAEAKVRSILPKPNMYKRFQCGSCGSIDFYV